MKITRFPLSRANHGSLLLVVMVTVIVLGIALAAVLSLTTHEQRILARTSAWNSALPVAEAGVEEAMSHLKQVNGGYRGVNGWVGTGSSFVLVRTNSDKSVLAVGVNSATPATILSVGAVWCPSAGSYIKRTIEVRTAQGQGFKGMTAKSKVIISGDSWTDSYDSTDPSKSTNGQYDPAKKQANGFVGTNSKIAGDMEFTGNAKINGKIATGPGGVLKIDSPARVGDFDWTASSANNGKVKPGWMTTDMNVAYPDVVWPTSTQLNGYPNVPGYLSNNRMMLSGTYKTSTLKIEYGQTMTIAGEVTIYVTDTFDMSGTGKLVIAPGGKLNLYVAKSTAVSGTGIVNQSGIPSNFHYYGGKENYQIYYSGSSTFIGVVYAPSAKMDLSGNNHFMGASVSAEIRLQNGFQFHYDESLGGDPSKLVLASWKEL